MKVKPLVVVGSAQWWLGAGMLAAAQKAPRAQGGLPAHLLLGPGTHVTHSVPLCPNPSPSPCPQLGAQCLP